MAIQTLGTTEAPAARRWWVRSGLLAAAASIVAVLAQQALALAIWPEIAAFQPLDNYGRTVLFVLVPTVAATAIFVWLSARSADPVGTFVKLALAVLVLSFIPDFVLPVPNKSLLASAVAASLHVTAAVIITGLLVSGYRRATQTAA